MRPATFRSEETFTQEEFAEWIAAMGARGEDHYELLNGRIVLTPPAGWPHGEVDLGVGEHIRRFVRRHRLGRALGSSQGYELPSGDTVEPDVSFVSSARWASGPLAQKGKFLRIVPDLVVEILSGSTAARDRLEKKLIYERNGVREYWLVDDGARTVTRFVLREGHFDKGTTFHDGESLVSEVLPGFELPVADVMPEPA
jgi:Uma2 family endonuclease